MSHFPHLPTLVDRPRMACPKGETRLEQKAAKQKNDYYRMKTFLQAVWTRDEGKCRFCGRKVKRSLELTPERGEVHHIASRGDFAVRYDARNGILLCATHHQAVERHQLVISGTKHQMFAVDGKHYLDAYKPLLIREARNDDGVIVRETRG